MKKRIIIGSILIVIGIIVYVLPSNRYQEKEIITNEKIKMPDMSTGISMMYESAAGSGEYVQSEESNWLGDGYVFNSELSGCENGGTLTWDETNKTVKLSTNKSDKCYVYFDVEIITIASKCPGQNVAQCMKQYAYTDETLLHHDASLENGANDDSYRYAGASENVNNYVCFGSEATPCPDDNKYRIIGVFEDQVKLIKATVDMGALLGTDGAYSYSTAYRWDRVSDYNNTWSHSLLNTVNLNINYINNIESTWSDKIATTTWQVGGMEYAKIKSPNTVKDTYEVEVGASKTDTPYSAKIGLMYLSDYGYAASQEHWTKAIKDYSDATTRANNWMYLGTGEWTISRTSINSDCAFVVRYGGDASNSVVLNDFAVRPVFFLESTVKLASGSGTSEDPYRIEI